MMESAQQLEKIDSGYYLISHQWFRVVYTILCNLQNTNSQIYKDISWQPYHWLSTKKEKKMKTFLQAFTTNFSWISLSFVIYITSTDHAQIDKKEFQFLTRNVASEINY